MSPDFATPPRNSAYLQVKGLFYHLLEEPDSPARQVFNLAMMVVVIASIAIMILEVDPDLAREELLFFNHMEDIFITIFSGEYMLRLWVCSDFHENFTTARRRYRRRVHEPKLPAALLHALAQGLKPKILWMLQPLSVVDLLAILPMFRVFRLFRVLRVLRILKLFRYSRRLSFFSTIIQERSYELIALISMAVVIWGMVAVAFFVVERGVNPKISSIWEAVYWAIITITTVGYGDITPATSTGQAIAVVGTLGGMWVIVFTTSIIVSTFTDRVVNLTEQRVESQVERMNGHVIVCGLDAMGRAACRVLQTEGKPFVGVDDDGEMVERARSHGWLAIQGDISGQEIWGRLGLKRAHSVIGTFTTEATNVYLILMVREQRPDCFIVSCGSMPGSEKRLLRVGANRVISPFVIGGNQMVNSALRPSALKFCDMAYRRDEHVELVLEELIVPSTSRMEGKPLSRLFARREFSDVIVIGYVPKGGIIRFNPAKETLLGAGAILICLGHTDDLERFRRAL